MYLSKTVLIAIALLLVLGIVTFFVYVSNQRHRRPNIFPQPSATASPVSTSSDTSPTPKPTSSPTPSASPSSEANITITAPTNGQTVGKSFTVSGQGRVFENVMAVRVINQRTGAKLFEQNTEAQSPDVGQFGPYTVTVNLASTADLKTGDKLMVESFSHSAKDGSEINKVSVVVSLQ